LTGSLEKLALFVVIVTNLRKNYSSIS